MNSKEKFPTFEYKLTQMVYQLLTPENFEELPMYMKNNGLSNLLIKKDIWNLNYLPDMSNFDFIKILTIEWTKVCDLTPIEKCTSVEKLILNNGDKTKLNYASFPFLNDFYSWDRKGIKDIWNVPTLKTLALYGLKKNQFVDGEALDFIEKLTIGITAVSNLDMLKKCRKLKYLQLDGMSKLEDFSFLEELPQLTYLNIVANKLKDFSIVRNLINLESCFIESKIGKASISDFENMKRLRNFSIKGNDELLSVRNVIKESLVKS